MRILITGASGFVGSHLGRAFGLRHDIFGTTFQSHALPQFPCHQVDLSDAQSATDFLAAVKPMVVIHCAAISRVIACEKAPTAANKMNVGATGTIVQWCRNSHTKLIFFSSDQVFDGQLGNYTEADTPAPINEYGRTKLAGEEIVLDASAANVVIRCNSVVGRAEGLGESYTEAVARSISNRNVYDAFVDQFRSPIHIRRMCTLIEQVIESDFRGCVNAGGSQRLSRFETAAMVAASGGWAERYVRPASFKSHEYASIMPADTSYDVSLMKSLMGNKSASSLAEDLWRDYRAAQLPA